MSWYFLFDPASGTTSGCCGPQAGVCADPGGWLLVAAVAVVVVVVAVVVAVAVAVVLVLITRVAVPRVCARER